MKPIKSFAIVLCLGLAIVGCAPEPESVAEVPIPPEPVEPERVIPILTEAELLAKFTGKKHVDVLAFFGDPYEKETMPYRRNTEKWTFQAKVRRGDRTFSKVSLLMEYGKYPTAYGFPELTDPKRRATEMPEDEFKTHVMGKTAAEIDAGLGTPDWHKMGSPGRVYDMWIVRANTLFAGVSLTIEEGKVTGYSFLLGGKRTQ